MTKSEYLQLQKQTQYDYVEFCRRLLIPCSTNVKRFSDVAEPWQWNDAKIFSNVVGNLWGNEYPIRNIWLTRPRGHDKTSSIARLVLWCILFRRPNITPLNIYVAAVDKEQAGITLDSLKEVVQLNFPGLVKITKNCARSFGGKLSVLSSDVSSSYGLKANMIVFDELTHWTHNKSKQFFEALWSGRSKINNCITVVITNSGFKNSWQYHLLQELKNKPEWYIYDEPGRLAGWHSNVDELSSGLSPTAYRRLILNEWVEDEAVSLYHLFHDCITDSLPNASQCSRAIIAIDYASVQDLTAIVIALVHNDTIYIVDVIASQWPQDELEQFIVQKYNEYSQHTPVTIIADRYQMEYMSTRLRTRGIRMELIKPTLSYNRKAVHNLYSAMRHLKVMFANPYLGEYRGETLDTEFRHAQVSLASGRIEPDRPGVHDDRIHAIMYAINYAVEQGLINIRTTFRQNIRQASLISPESNTNSRYNVVPNIKRLQHKTSVFGIEPNNIDAETQFSYQLKQQLDNIIEKLKQRKVT